MLGCVLATACQSQGSGSGTGTGGVPGTGTGGAGQSATGGTAGPQGNGGSGGVATGGATAATGGSGTGGAAGGGAGGGATGSGGKAASGGAAGGSSGGSGGSGGGHCGDATASSEPLSKSLAGAWDFTPSNGAKRSIQVPGGGWLKQGINAPSGTYATQITVPDSGGPQTTLIEFGAVNYQATLSVDGKQVATNTTSFTPSVFDVTKFVTPGKQHAITVQVNGGGALKSGNKSLVPNAAGWSQNVAQGIFRSATMRVLPDVYISDAFVRTSVTDDSLTYDVTLANTGASSQQVTLSGALASWNCDNFNYPSIPDTTVTVPAGGTATTTVGPVKWGLGSTSYWWPNVPYQADYQARLHNLTLQVSRGGQAIHAKVVRFGFRQSERRRADSAHVYYYLNGIRVNLRGDNIQGADYDSIDNGGKGDAYDTLPGFMPPTAQNPGWPQAVRNYQRLNYNFVRVHQELAAPYMLDVADELGLMLMGETAIRGSSNDQDFAAGHDAMVNHAKAMVLRDRNHPSIIRWSQVNEPNGANTDSNQFEADLFNAITKLDSTRPISVDLWFGGGNYGLPAPAFATIHHYSSGLGAYSEEVNVSNDNPYGQGEYIWSHDNSRQGLTWFGTSAFGMRRQDASDVRPYTLLSGWASFVPGVLASKMTIEQGGPPVFGEDNLPDPWSSPIIRRIQAGFNPVLVADRAYWDAAKMSNSNGDWPATVPSLAKGATRATTLVIFNDTFSGTTVDVTWEVHSDSATGAIAGSGTFSVEVPLASMATKSVTITAPTSGTKCALVLRAQKNGVTLFEEKDELFTLQ
ncbi:MAG TPA: glycoside hydrolase family 2 TIM barrel-domain containing protein [Polyangia bacterium]|nr:glycoside hydrolase family 2 TIM barrel-domain containing protein [Polyangia bacterium]